MHYTGIHDQRATLYKWNYQALTKLVKKLLNRYNVISMKEEFLFPGVAGLETAHTGNFSYTKHIRDLTTPTN